MRFGIFSNGARRNLVAADSYHADLAGIIQADRLGMHEAWVSEHAALRPDVLPTSDPLIAMAAGLTSHIRLAPAVRILPALHPVDVATQAAVCDHLLRGRYMLGIGSGSEFGKTFADQRGIDHGLRYERLRESLDIIVKCWTEPNPVAFEGKYWHGGPAPVNPKPYTSPHPHIGMATEQDELIDLAASRGYTLLAAQYDGPDCVRQKGDRYVASQASGSAPRSLYTVARQIFVGESDAAAVHAVKEDVNRDFLTIKSAAPQILDYVQSRCPGLRDVDFDSQRQAGMFIAGDAEEVYGRLESFYRESGGFGTLLIVMGKDWGTAEQRAQSLQLFMSEVAPRLKRLAERESGVAATPA